MHIEQELRITANPHRTRGLVLPDAAPRAAAALLYALASWSCPAAAQPAASVSATSDVRLRGLSLNGGGAALTASLAYDHPSGLYGGVTATGGDTRRFGLQFLSRSVYAGYAGRLTRSLAGEAGIIDTFANSNVFRRFSGHYTEIYAGLGTERINARVFYAPSFFASGLHAAYLDVNGAIRVFPRLRIFGHGGVLVPLGGPGGAILPRARSDLRIGAAAQRGRAEFQLAWVHSGAGGDYLGPRRQAADALIGGASWSF